MSIGAVDSQGLEETDSKVHFGKKDDLANSMTSKR